jgi:hypothetical protein
LVLFANTLPTFKTSHLGVSKFDFLPLYPFRYDFQKILTEPFTIPILPMSPKLYRFGFQNYNTHLTQNNIVLAINFFLKKKKKKEEENRGWLEPPPPPPPRAAHSRSEGGPATPKKQIKKMKNGFWSFGGGPGLGATLYDRYEGGRSHPRPLGVVWSPPKAQNPFFIYFYFYFYYYFWPFGGG